ncbi:MAG: glucosaminidase domain-containing protein [Bacteroidales bacterium]|nr:glucosaminidase domain-containing protein [Bacteroidales bacterium]
MKSSLTIKTTHLILLLALSGLMLNGQKITREKYIADFSELAMREMHRVGIPASITLAQGCLESNNGNSTLATRGNNHFGIKCHDWTGKKMYHDDDKRHECFRSYPSAYDSYMDHSQFLTTKSRYASLFEISPHDYRGWAKGLKAAGYATANNYATLLIRIIEENQLYQYDLMVLNGSLDGIDTTSYLAGQGATTKRKVLLNNRIEYILSEPGDTPESLRAELGLYKNEIYKYNNLYKGAKLETGSIIYLQPKRKKAAPGNEIHRVEFGQTMYDISQIYGVKLKHLYRKNHLMEGEQPLEATDIYLRRKKREPVLKLEPSQEQYEEEEMQFRFEH